MSAMKGELASMYKNDVQNLDELLDSYEPIGCKQVFKTKQNAPSEIKSYKVRSVAKGYT